MSYLRRRVPELADMARWVVKAWVERCAREERHRAQMQSSTSSKAGTASKNITSAVPSASKNKQPEHALGPKMKRLFQVAIIKLYEERTHPRHPPGPTKEEIATYMKRTDTRWARVEEWVAGDELNVPEREDRVCYYNPKVKVLLEF
ncbi:hypothetical protein FIBSPDRAFT_924182 [Athelia psychrophila]|uniref:Uncharacterized protein n=1 Tax=Athelia psychrophila TaxID=1759441 RepID=A0A166WFW7_9AGAM|nr:hypothetical protein FIBSPDRAFT_924182 [Fibularhizoctonia sp. CBS 109695]